MSDAAQRPLLEALGASRGFRCDQRYQAQTAKEAPLPDPATEPADPLALAWAEGHAAGLELGRTEAEAEAQAQVAARDALALSLARLDGTMAEDLRLRLRDVVAALCEAAIAPLALDGAALVQRIERALAMLSRTDDERLIRLHPDDLALIAPGLGGGWTVQADPALERGAIRVETPGGGIEDGPAQWRLAIAEALHQC